MEKNKECEIVQDLLLGYVDDTLNNESKKLVENHIKNCKSCKLKLDDMKKDSENAEKQQKKEIDYLKKIRRKSRIKSIFGACLFIAILVFIIYLRKYLIINEIVNNSANSYLSNNFYKEAIQVLGNNKTAVNKTYFKDGKYKTVYEIYSDSGVKIESASFGEVGTDEITYVDFDEKKIKVNKGGLSEIYNQEPNIKRNYFQSEKEYITIRLGRAIWMDIFEDNYEYGSEYYVLKNAFEKNQRWEIWVDKETGLVIKEINRGAWREFFHQSTVTKSVGDLTIEYRYNFDILTDDDVKMIDTTGFEIEYVDLDKEDEML